jgi:hypothetical protein
MNEVKIYKSKWKATKLFILSLPFVALGIWDLSHHPSTSPIWLDWTAVCFFGLGSLLGLFNLFDNRTELVINENGIFSRLSYGIFDKSTDKGFVKWDSIIDAYLNVFKNSYWGLPLSKHKTICLTVNGKVVKRSKLSKAFGMGDFNIPLINLKSINEDKLITFIKAMSQADVITKQQLLQDFKI